VVQSWDGTLSVPNIARERYYTLMDEWQDTNPIWDCDEEEFCRWIAQQHPTFFDSEIPFLGYLQIRLESFWLNKEIQLQTLRATCSWGISGLMSDPPDANRVQSDHPWQFRLPKLPNNG
jgi:hypothetical protein